jgi:pilus assembly protein CpaB
MNRRVLIITLAVLLAVLGTAGVFVYVKNADSRALAGQRSVSVLVAQERIPAGTSGADAREQGLVRTDQLPASAVPQDALSAIGSDLDALVTAADLPAGMVVLAPIFVPATQLTAGLVIPAGRVAVTVSVDAPQRVGGIVEAGSKVAVFDTFNVLEGQPGLSPSGNGLQEQYEYNRATRLLLASADVLAIRAADKAAETEDGTAEQPTETALVTFAVSQADAEKLILGQQTGSLYMALLGADSAVVPGPGVDNRTIFGS